MNTFVLIWIFSSMLGQKAYSGSAEFNSLHACEEAKREIEEFTPRDYRLIKCFPKGEK